MKTTPFTPYHIRNGARMAEFASYDMPIEFTGINDEHTAVRARAGVFDVSHMGEIWVKGPRALDLLRYVGSNDAASLYDGKIQYSCLPNGRGGIVDDILVYRIDAETYLLVVNAANVEKDWNHLVAAGERFGLRPGRELYNASDEIAQLAVQGPLAMRIVQRPVPCRRPRKTRLLYVRQDRGRRHRRRYRIGNGLHRSGRMRNLRSERGRSAPVGSAVASRRERRAAEYRARRARHAAARNGLLPLRQRHRRYDVARRGRFGLDHQDRRRPRLHRPPAARTAEARGREPPTGRFRADRAAACRAMATGSPTPRDARSAPSRRARCRPRSKKASAWVTSKRPMPSRHADSGRHPRKAGSRPDRQAALYPQQVIREARLPFGEPGKTERCGEECSSPQRSVSLFLNNGSYFR